MHQVVNGGRNCLALQVYPTEFAAHGSARNDDAHPEQEAPTGSRVLPVLSIFASFSANLEPECAAPSTYVLNGLSLAKAEFGYF
jgi:hypothetical protein